jgi:tRNA-Thr(GGU) m(6)t(6)A37 methyltransferase TsaA
MIEITPIGIVKNKFDLQTDLNEIRQNESIIIINEEYEEGLFRIDESKYLQLVFGFHLSKDYNLIGPIFDGQVKGVFASRSPRRPNGIGITTVELLEKNGRKLRVRGLDALNGTPVLDIKPYTPFLDENKQIELMEKCKMSNPRSYINKWIRHNNYNQILLKAGELHGHYCPGLSLGVLAGAYAMKEIGINSNGMEKVIAIVETNNCFSDGIQYVTGCSFGNNALIYRDFGKTAVTVSKRDGHGLRLSVKPGANEMWQHKQPKVQELFQKVVTERKGNKKDAKKLKEAFREISFDIVNIKINDLFTIQNLSVDIPDYAPIHESVICEICNENIMSSRAIKNDSNCLCIPCSKSEYFELDGSGIKKERNLL